MKQCSRCKEHKAVEEFAADRTRKDGLSKWCRVCVSKNGQIHYQRNRQRLIEQQRQRRAENPEKYKEQAKASRDKYPERNRERARLYYAKNRERILARNSEDHRIKRYGLSNKQFHDLLDSQDGLCAICGTDSPVRWHVDHDHSCCPSVKTCGQCIRGILCNKCNTALGLLGDNAERCENAAIYLRAH